jgi:hypothetical protein
MDKFKISKIAARKVGFNIPAILSSSAMTNQARRYSRHSTRRKGQNIFVAYYETNINSNYLRSGISNGRNIAVKPFQY